MQPAALPALPHAKFMTAAKHKRRVGSSSVSRSRYRFSNPILLYPKTLFSSVTVAEREREEGEKKGLKCSCLACVYFHPSLQTIRDSVLLQLEEGADSQAKLGCFPSSQEEALRSVYTGTDVDRTHFSAAVKAAQSSNSHTGLRLVKVWVQFSEYSCFY